MRKGAEAPQLIDLFGSASRTRTYDPVINSHLLYQLSYRGRGAHCKGQAALPQDAVFSSMT